MKMTLKALRVNADMTQKETAERLGISVSTLMFWEQGKRYPNVKDIQKIEKLFNVNYDDIIFQDNIRFKQIQLTKKQASNEEKPQQTIARPHAQRKEEIQ